MLVRTNINNSVRVYYTAANFLSNDHSLCAPITSDECHAWFHLYCLSRPAWHARKVENTKWKTLPAVGLEPATFGFVVGCSSNRPIGTSLNTLVLKLPLCKSPINTSFTCTDQIERLVVLVYWKQTQNLELWLLPFAQCRYFPTCNKLNSTKYAVFMPPICVCYIGIACMYKVHL